MDSLSNTLKAFFSPPVFEGDDEKTLNARLLHQITIAIWSLPIIALLIGIFNPNGGGIVLTAGGILAVALIAITLLSRAGQVRLASVILVGITVFVLTFLNYANAGQPRPLLVLSVIAIMMSGLLLGTRSPIVIAVLLTIQHVAILLLASKGLIVPFTGTATPVPQNALVTGVSYLLIGFMLRLAMIRVQFAINQLQISNRELQELSTQLEKRVEERTKALETSAEVSRRIASILDPGQLASAVVNEIRNAYNYYYAQIYLFDEAGENLMLTAGTGAAGAEMLQRGHSLPKGRGLVGQAAERKESILVSDTSQDPNWLPNELLPDTQAEATVPILLGDKVLGVLDVQDNIKNDIFPEDITLLESLAGQVAISIQNARSFQQATRSQDQFALVVEGSNDGIWDWDIENDTIFYSARWKAMLGYEEHELTRGFIEWDERIHPEDRDYAVKALDDYLAQRAPAYDVEIRLRHKDGTWRWIRDRGRALRKADGSAYRMAGAHTDLTEIKLQQDQAAQRARQQEAINVISQKIQATTTIEEAMQVAARELGHALGKRQTLVALEPSVLGNESKGKSERKIIHE